VEFAVLLDVRIDGSRERGEIFGPQCPVGFEDQDPSVR
jgi:hypothetical protein